MVRSRRHPAATPQPSPTSEIPDGHAITVYIPENDSLGHEMDPNSQRVGELELEPDIRSEMAQEVWDALKEEFYEQIEQLPLSLHRSFALIGEQDKEVEACRAELLPTIRSYVKLRLSLQPNISQSLVVQGSHEDVHTPPIPVLHERDPEIDKASPDASAPSAEQYRADISSEPELQPEVRHVTKHKEEDVDVIVGDVPSQAPPRASVSPPAVDVALITPDSHLQSQSASARTQGLRETDASVPKSVPFPPRQKPKTTRELLTRIAFLMGEVIRASEEKVGLATAAYDSVDRHVRVLDTAIQEHDAVATLRINEGALPVGIIGTIDPTSNLTADDDDEEPQLGMIGPSGNYREHPASLRRGKKRDRRDKQTHVPAGNSVPRINAFPPAPNRELPIDPHEPRYCFCYQVSYGEMIACDNPDCRREWFHLGCAGLQAPPKGKVKWYCSECEELLGLGKNRKRKIR